MATTPDSRILRRERTMLQLTNHTPFLTERSVQIDRFGNQVWVVVIKGTFRFGDGSGPPALDPEPEPVCLAPVYRGVPGRSSLLREAEMVAEHPGTDVTLIGTARAPKGKPVLNLDVGLRVGDVAKSVRVFGKRTWKSGVLGLRPGEPEPFVEMPLTYERAFGGEAVIDAAKGTRQGEARNPVGLGFYARAGDAVGKALPNLEDPATPIRSPKDRPQPAGFGPVAANWSPRLERAGTFDDRWRRDRMPVWPEDHDPRQAQSAPPGLTSDVPLKGGETVELVHLTPKPKLTFRLPKVYLVVSTSYRGEQYRQAVQLDRVILLPDDGRVVMVWRSWMNCHNDARKVEVTTIRIKPYLR